MVSERGLDSGRRQGGTAVVCKALAGVSYVNLTFLSDNLSKYLIGESKEDIPYLCECHVIKQMKQLYANAPPIKLTIGRVCQSNRQSCIAVVPPVGCLESWEEPDRIRGTREPRKQMSAQAQYIFKVESKDGGDVQLTCDFSITKN